MNAYCTSFFLSFKTLCLSSLRISVTFSSVGVLSTGGGTERSLVPVSIWCRSAPSSKLTGGGV